jgi:hypothetical protein
VGGRCATRATPLAEVAACTCLPGAQSPKQNPGTLPPRTDLPRSRCTPTCASRPCCCRRC